MRKLLMASAAGLLIALAVVAQPIMPTSWTGNEVFTIELGPGGTGLFINLAQVRNATAGVTTTTATGTFTSTNLMNRVIYTAALSGAVTHNTPTNPFDGEMMEIVNGTGLAFTQTITFTATGTQTVNSGALATLAAGASGEWQYIASTNTWYRIR